MKRSFPNINYAWAHLIVEELIRSGVDTFFVAPGSRSSPLALTVDASRRANVHVHFDERGLAFAALGYARAAGRPAAVITTSGTAVANLFPAICEASLDFVPMILLTADRPPELRDTGANQTMPQPGLFGDYARWSCDLPAAGTETPADFVRYTIQQAVHRATNIPCGPVHLNIPFREPLAPVRDGSSIRSWLKSMKPVAVDKSAPVLDVPDDALRLVQSARRGVIIAGDLRTDKERRALISLARRIRWPVLADIRAGIRGLDPVVIRYADQILQSARTTKRLVPDVVLRVGGRIVSKRVQSLMDHTGVRARVIVHPSPHRFDTVPTPTVRVHAELSAVARRFKGKPSSIGKAWVEADTTTANVLGIWDDEQRQLTEPLVARMLVHSLPRGHRLVLGNSMPVRDADMFGANAIHCIANRGVSGIDGNIATAVGVAIGSGKPVTLLVGDVAALHDLNSLELVSRCRVPVRIVLINNNGGGVFSFLPISGAGPAAERMVATPHGRSFEDAAAMFGLRYAFAQSRSELESALRWASLIEVATDRADNLKVHRDIARRVIRALE